MSFTDMAFNAPASCGSRFCECEATAIVLDERLILNPHAD
jgi:hypothetical protein